MYTCKYPIYNKFYWPMTLVHIGLFIAPTFHVVSTSNCLDTSACQVEVFFRVRPVTSEIIAETDSCNPRGQVSTSHATSVLRNYNKHKYILYHFLKMINMPIVNASYCRSRWSAHSHRMGDLHLSPIARDSRKPPRRENLQRWIREPWSCGWFRDVRVTGRGGEGPGNTAFTGMYKLKTQIQNKFINCHTRYMLHPPLQISKPIHVGLMV